jgi:hypothetical protein
VRGSRAPGGGPRPRPRAAPIATVLLLIACAPQSHVIGRGDGGPVDPCAPRVVAPLPVDLIVVLDASIAMATGSVWRDVRGGLVAFAAAAPAAGARRIGVVLHPAQLPCTADDDCGASARPGICAGAGACVAPTGQEAQPSQAPQDPLLRCQGMPPACAGASSCRLRGSCSLSHLPCLAGLPCPGGRAGDVCVAQSLCPSADDSACDPRLFSALDVPLGSSALTAPALDTLLQLRDPAGLPTLARALEASYALLRAETQGAPRRGAVVVIGHSGSFAAATCPDRPTEAPMVMAASALAASPSIRTHLVNVLPSGLQGPAALAGAGGGLALEIATPAQISTGLAPALTEIEANARACEMAVPAALASDGSSSELALSLWLTIAGQRQPLGGPIAPDDCPEDSRANQDDGWFLRPGDSTTPALAVLCPATCARFRADTSSQVALARSCSTRD